MYALLTTTCDPAAYSDWLKFRPACSAAPDTPSQGGFIPATCTVLSFLSR